MSNKVTVNSGDTLIKIVKREYGLTNNTDIMNTVNLIKEKNLNNIIMLGAKKNPYPYFKLSDCFILSSQFEGYPVVFVEAQILGLPILTTNVSDSEKDIDGIYGQVVENSEKGVYKGMKQVLEKGITSTKFDPEKFNEEITQKVKQIIEN